MPSGEIHLGFEARTGKAIRIPIGHLAVTGQTQQAGKTTALEGLVSRSGSDAIAFLTKRGEGSFRVASYIAPYFRDRTDWPFIKSILEARAGEKLKFELAQIIQICQDYTGPEGTWTAPKTLADVLANAEKALGSKVRGFVRNVYTVLTEYLREVVPGIESMPYSRELELRAGLNVMDLIHYTFPVQALVIRSAIEWVLHEADATIVVIPEAWKFAPRRVQTPVRFASEEFIRQGAALKNFLWVDSQDLASVSAVILRQVRVWLFGIQREATEIEKTLALIPDDVRKPRKADIAHLGLGQFIVCFDREMHLVQVQPAWMTAAHCEAIARGEESIDSARQVLQEYDEQAMLEEDLEEEAAPDYEQPER